MADFILSTGDKAMFNQPSYFAIRLKSFVNYP
jgi:hypothetical protein